MGFVRCQEGVRGPLQGMAGMRADVAESCQAVAHTDHEPPMIPILEGEGARARIVEFVQGHHRHPTTIIDHPFHP